MFFSFDAIEGARRRKRLMMRRPLYPAYSQAGSTAHAHDGAFGSAHGGAHGGAAHGGGVFEFEH